jgi:hypothetical protein
MLILAVRLPEKPGELKNTPSLADSTQHQAKSSVL